MKIVKITTAAGNEVHINADLVLSISRDPMHPERTVLFLDPTLFYVIKSDIADTIKLLSGK